MRLLAKCLIAIFGFLALFIAILPMLLSAPTFQKYSLEIVNSYLPGKLDAKRLHLSWLRGQRIDDLQFTSKQNDYYLNAKEITTDTPLWKLLFTKSLSGMTQISSLSASWKKPGDAYPITLQEVNGQLRFPTSAQQGVAEFIGKTSMHGSSGDFRLHVEGLQWPIRSTETRHPLQIKANLVNFPVDILEAVITTSKPELKGVFRELFGENLNLVIDQTYEKNESSLVLKAKSSNNLLLNIEGTVIPGDRIALRAGELNLTLTPALVKKFSPSLSLKNDSVLNARLSQGTIPWKFIEESKKNSPFELHGDITLSAIALEDLVLKKVEMKIQAPAQNETAQIQISGNLLRQDLDSNFRLNFEMEKPTCKADFAVCELPSQAIVSLESPQFSVPALHVKLLEKLTLKKLSNLNSLSVELKSDKISLRNKELTSEVVLRNVNLPFEYAVQGHKRNIAFKLDASDDKGINSISSKGALSIPSNTSNLNNLSLIFSANLNQFPGAQFLSIVNPDASEMTALLMGERVSGDLKAELVEGRGPIQMQLKGSQGSIVLNGKINRGILELNRAFVAETNFSPSAVSTSLKKRFPVLSIVKSTESPLKITVKEGSVIPLNPFNPNKLVIGEGVLELGRITVKNRGQIRDLLNIFQARGKDDVSIWFTPLYFKVDDGLVQVKRIDMLLANIYPIASWGKVDLVKNRVSLIVGITGAALSNAVGIPLDSKYMLQLSLKGTVQQPRLEKEKAAMQLGALIAQSKGTTEGMIIGTLLDLANGKLKEGKVPPPMTDPLPWGDVIQRTTTVNDESTKERSDKSLIKQVEKQAASILDQLLK